MKNFFAVLRQKEQEIAQLRKEIRALRTVIPLLQDEASSWNEIEAQLPSSASQNESAASDEMTDLARYYPFVKTIESR